jgi:hypothetical protein
LIIEEKLSGSRWDIKIKSVEVEEIVLGSGKVIDM